MVIYITPKKHEKSYPLLFNFIHRRTVRTIPLKAQLSMITTDLIAKESGMISANFEIVKIGGIREFSSKQG
jgi:hypothetical protein